MNWLSVHNNGAPVALDTIPELAYAQFRADMVALLADQANHCTAYFAVPAPAGFRFYALVVRDAEGDVLIASHVLDYYQEELPEALSADLPALHVFEREITELHGIRFRKHPWPKPLRYPFDRFDPNASIDNYPFYAMESRELHEVQVGPVHAGIIEPGAFRFICDGEKILHLEIALGYQHRGVERLMAGSGHGLRRMALAESIAGDTAVGHATAAARILEAGICTPRLDLERAIALEMERMAVHIGDTAALCMDIAYQTGHVACEALRTMVINSMQQWCGNRFGKGLIRPFGTNCRLDAETIEYIEKTLSEVVERYALVAHDLLTTPSILARLEQVCIVSREQALRVGAVGPAARMAGVVRDLRATHPIAEPTEDFTPVVQPDGDLLARLRIRLEEVPASFALIRKWSKEVAGRWFEACPVPEYERPLPPDALLFSLVEGWRGEICHVAITSAGGGIETYKIVDPSVHNWMMLALSVRGAQISDFPVSNKSFNLSYCGHDL